MLRRLALLALLPLLLGAAEPRPTGEQVEKLRRSLIEAGRAERAGQAGRINARKRLERLNAEEAALDAQISKNRETLTKLLSVLERLQADPPPALLVSPSRARDAVRAAILIRSITPDLQERGRAFAVQAQALAKLRRAAAVEGETLFEAESAVADRRDDIARMARQKRSLEQSLAPDAVDPMLGELAQRAHAPGELVQGMTERPDDAPLPETIMAKLTPPVQGPQVRKFGEGGEGVAWRPDPGSPVLSPADARVDYAGPLKGWGLVAILRLSKQHRVVLAGLDSVSVGPGRMVAAGEPLGRMAEPAPGKPEPELYLELRRGAAPVDPGRWLAATSP
jgi:septal ring factor EnvC (AmiA/AmiB activator)